MQIRVTGFDKTATFERDLKKAPLEIQERAKAVLRLLQENPSSNQLRLHTLKGYAKPQLFKIDVETNRSWQITFELNGKTAILLRLDTHISIDRRPR